MQNPDILALIASRLSSTELELLFEAGLWPIVRLFAGTQHFAYLRCRSELRLDLVWRHDWDWRRMRYGLRTHEFRKHERPNLDYRPVVRTLISSVKGNAVALGLILDNLEDNEQLTSVGSAFVDAARCGHLAVMQLLLDRYPERIRPGKLSEALSWAASEGHIEVVAILLSKPELVPDQWTLHGCCGSGHVDIARLLLADERVVVDDDQPNPLIAAAYDGHIEMTRFLLTYNDGKRRIKREQEILRIAATNGHSEIVRLLLDDEELDPNWKRGEVFREACARGKLECARVLVEYGIRANVDNNYSLRFAASNGREEVVAWLLTFDYVNPLVGRPNAVKRAWKNNKAGVLDLLLRDRRVPISRVSDRSR